MVVSIGGLHAPMASRLEAMRDLLDPAMTKHPPTKSTKSWP